VADVTKHETELTQAQWDEIKEHARPGDVLLLRHLPKEGKDCLLELIHVFDGPYDHAALVRSNDRKGTVRIAHVTTANPAVSEGSLDKVIKRPGVKWVRAELRRRWPDAGPNDGDVAKIVKMADPRAWPDAHYGFSDLLVAALAATKKSPVGRRDDGREVDERALKVVRARLLALCYIELNDLEPKEHTAGVTCASFVNSCHDGANQLHGPFPTIDERLAEFDTGEGGGADAAARLVDGYRQQLKTPNDMHELLSREVCLDAVAAKDEVSDGQVTHMIVQLLRTVAKLHVATSAYVTAEGEPRKLAPDADRLLVTIKHLHTDDNLSFGWVEPPRVL
jgi:hypothetical protein